MERISQAQVSELKRTLEQRERELRDEVNAAREAMQAADALGDGEARDSKDQAERVQQLDELEAQRARDAAELVQVRAALGRMQRGGYGDCNDCGAPIAPARLAAQPSAIRCAACQSALESNRRG